MVMVAQTGGGRCIDCVGLSVYPLAACGRARRTAHGSNAQSAREPFRVADFVAPPLLFTPGGRSLPYHMPVALPSQFDLRVEILSSRRDLANVYIAGHPLIGQPSGPTADPARTPPLYAESWHQVRLKREGQVLSLWIDGRKMLVSMSPKATSEWLTFEPGPDQPTHFRNLVVEW